MALPVIFKAALLGAAAYAVARVVKSQQLANQSATARDSTLPSNRLDEHEWPTSPASSGPAF